MICTTIQNRGLEEIMNLLESGEPRIQMAEIRLDRCPLGIEEIECLFSSSDTPLVATCRVADDGNGTWEEAWGRGIPDIFGECKAAGLPAPVFETIPNFVCLTIRFKNPLRPYITGESNGALNGELNGELNDALKGLGAPVLATYNIIKQNPGIQRKDIITHTRKGSSTIDRHLALLTKKNLIEHRDSKKTGGYYAFL